MDTDAITMMTIGIIMVWGGLAVSIVFAIRKEKQKRNDN